MIALVYLFGRQGMIPELLFGHSIYGPIGIVIAEVFFTLPHAILIIVTALSIADSRLYEAAVALRASKYRATEEYRATMVRTYLPIILARAAERAGTGQ